MIEDKYICFNLIKTNKDYHHSWSILPHNVWIGLLQTLKNIGINEVAFEGVMSVDDVSNEEFKEKLYPKCLVKYKPFHNKVDESICVFHLESELFIFLRNLEVYDFNATNSDYPYDEIIFLKDGVVRSTVVPYESQILLFDFDSEDYQMLFKFISDIDKHLHPLT